MWSYLTALVMAAGATVVVLLALFLRFLPHDLLISVGLACQTAEGCIANLPAPAEGAMAFAVGGVLVGLFIFGGLAGWAQFSATGRQHAALSRCCTPLVGRFSCRLPGTVLVAEDPAPVSYTIGFLRPRVVISTGLLEALDGDEVEAVLAHEQGHIAGRDNLLVLVARTLALTFAFLPGVRLAADRLRRAQELAADGFARAYMGDGLVVASSLQKFARSLIAPAPVMAVVAGFADEGNVPERIRGLLRDEVVLPSRRYLAAGLIVLGLVFAGFAGSAAAFSDVTMASASECAICHTATQRGDVARASAGAGGAPAGTTGTSGVGSAAGAHVGVSTLGSTCAH